jgi:hypothetical protein
MPRDFFLLPLGSPAAKIAGFRLRKDFAQGCDVRGHRSVAQQTDRVGPGMGACGKRVANIEGQYAIQKTISYLMGAALRCPGNRNSEEPDEPSWALGDFLGR